MAFSRGKTHSETAKKEQIITELFAKSAHIILESRAPYVSSRNSSVESPSSSPSSSSSHRPRDKWFNLTLRECPAALENIDFWKQSNLDPMVIDVILIRRETNREPAKTDRVRNRGLNTLETEESKNMTRIGKVIERWVVQYHVKKSKDGSSRSKRSCGNLQTLYKKSILLLRSLYTTVRLLPAYKLFRELISSGHIRSYTLTHRINSFVKPLVHKEEADMRRFCFMPVETSPGQICLSVWYHDTLDSEMNFEPLVPVYPQFIPNYVDSSVVDPIKSFPSPPVSRSQSLPSYVSLSSDYSWSSCVYYGSPPSILPSPSPTNSDCKASVSKLKLYLPPMSTQQHMPEIIQNNIKFDGNRPSPACSLSQRESANKFPCALDSPNEILSLPSPPKLMEPCPGTDGSLGGKFSLGRDEGGRSSGLRLSSFSSPRVSISGSYSRLSIHDGLDDAELACHFAVQRADIPDSSNSRLKSYNPRKQPGNLFESGGFASVSKSQDAAVGALVLMLKKAPPLQHNCTNSTLPLLTTSKPGNIHLSLEQGATHSSMASSVLMLTKTNVDVLMELRTYREMKERFLRQGGAAVSSDSIKDGGIEKE